MKDLISRSEVLETLKEVFAKYHISYGGSSGGFAQAVPEAIKNIPTAYDVDKVVERVEQTMLNRANPCEALCFAVAIGIVKEGGVNE